MASPGGMEMGDFPLPSQRSIPMEGDEDPPNEWSAENLNSQQNAYPHADFAPRAFADADIATLTGIIRK